MEARSLIRDMEMDKLSNSVFATWSITEISQLYIGMHAL